ncbi:MAG: glycerate kinase [Verrucomicrobiota bacterium]|jgi:glycerate kinase
MPLRILIIPDKFKGTLAAGAAAQAIAKGWHKARRQDSLDLLPMTDGGDGFGEVISSLLRARVQHLETVDAAHRPCSARWWWEPRTKTAVIESAAIIGLAMLPPGRFHPFELDTFGLGAVIRAAAAKGARRCLMGIGGSATNDGGFGLACSLGWQFLDRNGDLIEQWTGLDKLAKIHAPSPRRRLRRVLVAVDVQNLLLGPRGATRVYGPQKGLRSGDFVRAERCLRQLAEVIKKDFGRDLARIPGAGGAGGLGFGLLAFLGAQLEPGFDLFARQAAVERHLRSADLVIIGEGAIDSSTFMGKGVGQIAARCRRQGIPCVALAGYVSTDAGNRKLFTQTHALTKLTAVAQAKAEPAYWLERLATRIAQSWKTTKSRHPSHRKGTKHHAD